ncbi:hypothetical protein Bbelb_124780 [Branchiostoma belcheri]|nr:hypothetical protein Bbelb_124780 [Branchiostoma belcheri]
MHQASVRVMMSITMWLIRDRVLLLKYSIQIKNCSSEFISNCVGVENVWFAEQPSPTEQTLPVTVCNYQRYYPAYHPGCASGDSALHETGKARGQKLTAKFSREAPLETTAVKHQLLPSGSFVLPERNVQLIPALYNDTGVQRHAGTSKFDVSDVIFDAIMSEEFDMGDIER